MPPASEFLRNLLACGELSTGRAAVNRTVWICTWLLGVGACMSSGDGGAAAGTGRDTPAAAAEDLTNALMLAGGEVVSGDIPAADATDVTVTPGGDTLTLVPGEADILPLGVDNPDEDTNPVAAALLQFDGADDHIRAEGTSMGGMLAQMYSVADSACDKLCNKVYTITMYEAVELEDGSVSERAVQTIDLDCTKDGDAKLCGDGKGGSGGSGGAGGSGATGGTGATPIDPKSAAGMLQNSLMALSNEICKCLGGTCGPEQTLGIELDCLGAVFVDHETESEAYLSCANAEVQAAASCVVNASCDPTAIAACWPPDEPWGSVVNKVCGASPAGFDVQANVCASSTDAGVPGTGGTSGTGTGCKADEFECDDGTCYPDSFKCDGADDCSAGEDEQGCP